MQYALWDMTVEYMMCAVCTVGHDGRVHDYAVCTVGHDGRVAVHYACSMHCVVKLSCMMYAVCTVL